MADSVKEHRNEWPRDKSDAKHIVSDVASVQASESQQQKCVREFHITGPAEHKNKPPEP